MTLLEVSRKLNRRLASIFMPDSNGWSPWQGDDEIYSTDPNWRGLTHFHEYFHADNGRGCGASHQTGWTALVARCLPGKSICHPHAGLQPDPTRPGGN